MLNGIMATVNQLIDVDVIKKVCAEYNLEVLEEDLDAVDTYNTISSKVTVDGLTKKGLAEYYISNKESLNLSDIDIDNLDNYLEYKLYSLSTKDIEDLREYNDANDIYLHVNHVYVPNGIEIKKFYTYKVDTITVPEAYKRIIEKESCSVAGYKL